LSPATDPQKTLGGILLWGSMCYDGHNKQFVLFGGGNVPSERGGPGHLDLYPGNQHLVQLKLENSRPSGRNAKLVYDPVARKIVLFGGDHWTSFSRTPGL